MSVVITLHFYCGNTQTSSGPLGTVQTHKQLVSATRLHLERLLPIVKLSQSDSVGAEKEVFCFVKIQMLSPLSVLLQFQRLCEASPQNPDYKVYVCVGGEGE